MMMAKSKNLELIENLSKNLIKLSNFIFFKIFKKRKKNRKKTNQDEKI